MTLQDTPSDKVFWLHGGKTIKNILELAKELKQMNSETFAHYVTNEKNDFANWIQHCIKDEQLAALLKTTKNKERMAAIVERRIQELTRPREKPKQNIAPREKPKQTMPTVIRTKNVTPLKLSYQPTVVRTRKTTQLIMAQKEQPKPIIRTPHKTQLKLTHEEIPKKIIRTPHKTQLKLGNEEKEIYVHEVKTQHHSATLIISHLVLGIVIGVAIAALIIMFI